MTDKELNKIIDAPRPTFGRPLTSVDLDHYFDTMDGTVEPSWKFMEPTRMIELFNRFAGLPSLKPGTRSKIDLAISELKRNAKAR